MSQTSKLLKAFREAGSRGLTNHYIANNLHILRYSARIADLRAEGYNIPAPIQQRMFMSKKLSGTFKYYLIEDNNDSHNR